MSPIRVRFAPSPTGPLHLGGVRTALYNYLLVKKHGGSFIIRVEDTDQTRFTPGAEEHMIDSLAWLGLINDEGPIKGGDYGPYRQSERKDIYQKYAQQLLDNGMAYYAFDTADELDQMRETRKAAGEHSPKYDHSIRMTMRNSLTLSKEETDALVAKGDNVTMRLKVTPGETITFEDVVRGTVSFQSVELDDKILIKSDGMPTYHMANIIDDYSMKISHVIRGEDWLSSTPHHILLYRAFGWTDHIPVFIHLPLILKPTGKGKLSKRDGSKFGFPSLPTTWVSQTDDETFDGYREAGFLPEALNNFLAFLGWNPGTEQEIFSPDALAEAFSMDKIVKSGARFDYEKAKWFNQQFIIAKPNEELAELIKPELTAAGVSVSDEFVATFCGLMKERVHTLNEFWATGKYFFEAPTEYEEKMVRKKYKIDNRAHFEAIASALTGLDNFDAATIETTIKGYLEQHELKFGEIFPILRLAVSGTMKGPDLFGIIELLGKTELTQRMATALDHFDGVAAAKASQNV